MTSSALALPESTTWPSSTLIAMAREHAASLVNCPIRAQLITFDAVHLLYPAFGVTRLGLRLGFAHARRAGDIVSKAKARDWWDDSIVDDVIGFLVAPMYGDRAL